MQDVAPGPARPDIQADTPPIGYDVPVEVDAAPADTDPGDGSSDTATSADAPTDSTDTPAPADIDCTAPTAVINVAQEGGVAPGTFVALSGTDSIPCWGQITRYRWSVTQPPGNQQFFRPSNTSPETAFRVAVVGTYEFCLEVWDELLPARSDSTCVSVETALDRGVYIELTWETPGDPDPYDSGPGAGADLDLHFLHPNAPVSPDAPDLIGDGQPDPYFCPSYDCFWFNPFPTWDDGDSIPSVSPILAKDSKDGTEPEVVIMSALAPDTRYEVAVHYWNDWGYGPSIATVRVFVDGVLASESVSPEMNMTDLWCVVFIDGADGTIEPCTRPDGLSTLTPGYVHPLLAK